MTFYRTFLALHLIFVISWMAGILYVYRLFVYHAAETEAVVKERLGFMEGRLIRIILIPALFLTVLFGMLMLAFNPNLLAERWMHAKLACVIGLIFLSFNAIRMRQKLLSNLTTRSSTSLRWLNELPALLMVLIIFLVILRPF